MSDDTGRLGRDAIERDRWNRKGVRIRVAVCVCGAHAWGAPDGSAICDECRKRIAIEGDPEGAA